MIVDCTSTQKPGQLLSGSCQFHNWELRKQFLDEHDGQAASPVLRQYTLFRSQTPIDRWIIQPKAHEGLSSAEEMSFKNMLAISGIMNLSETHWGTPAYPLHWQKSAVAVILYVMSGDHFPSDVTMHDCLNERKAFLWPFLS